MASATKYQLNPFHILLTSRQHILTLRQQMSDSLRSLREPLAWVPHGGRPLFIREEHVQVKDTARASDARSTNIPPASVVFALFVVLLVLGSSIYVLGFYLK